jgi:hypothetical protein
LFLAPFLKGAMGNAFDSAPTSYSDQMKYGENKTWDEYEATYRQNSATADKVSYGDTHLQFGVKMIQDVDPGPEQGQMYVVNRFGRRKYFTVKGQTMPWAADIIKQGKNYGNGPAVSITGNPLNPQYHMFYAQGGDEHAGDQWTPIAINSKSDIMEAMTSGMGAVKLTGRYANRYGQASINPFGTKEGADVWTNAIKVGKVLNTVASQVIVPIAEMGLDAVVPFASTVMGALGINKAIQIGVDHLASTTMTGKQYQGTKQFDPSISNSIKDPRLSGYLQQMQDQSHQFIQKYGDSKYTQTNKLAQDTPQQQLAKARAISQENQDLYVQSRVQEMNDLSTKLQGMLKGKTDTDIFQNITTGLQMATTNQQKLNVINHFSGQIKSQLLPLLTSDTESTPIAPTSPPRPQSPHAGLTSSAQVGHPVLSINGTNSQHPAKTQITGAPGQFVPAVPF